MSLCKPQDVFIPVRSDKLPQAMWHSLETQIGTSNTANVGIGTDPQTNSENQHTLVCILIVCHHGTFSHDKDVIIESWTD